LGVVHDLYLIGGGRRTPGAGHWAAGLRRWPGNRSGEWETAERRRWSGCAGRSPVAGLAKLPGKESATNSLEEIDCTLSSTGYGAIVWDVEKTGRWGRHACRPAKSEEERYPQHDR
jgi:hypothetical protein